jgi:DNA gyrase subunit A
VRAKAEYEEFNKDRIRIIVTELPTRSTSASSAHDRDQVKDKRWTHQRPARRTDRNGMRIRHRAAARREPAGHPEQALKQTAMQSNFSVIMLALTDDQKQPKTSHCGTFWTNISRFRSRSSSAARAMISARRWSAPTCWRAS